jgi:hypothetical protein
MFKCNVSFNDQTIRPIICPERTKRGLAKGAIGTSTSSHTSRAKVSNAIHNPVNGPIYGPIYRERKQDELQATHEIELSKSKYKNEVSLGKEGAMGEADSIVQANEWFKSIDFLKIIFASTNLSSFKLSDYAISFVSFYIFYTSRDANIAGDEFAAFLGLRGGYFCDKDGVLHSKPGRPVLRHTEISPLYRRRESKSDGSIITRKQMINDIGFKVFGGVIFVILVTHYKHAISGKVLK